MSSHKNKVQTKIRMIQRDIASELDISAEEVEFVINSMWLTVRETMTGHPINAIYLRHLGTFYGKESVYNRLEEFRSKKNGTKQLQGGE